MKRLFAFVPLAATAVALTMSPALAKTTHHPARQNYEEQYQEPYEYAPAPYAQWGYADPSYTSPGYNQARRLGRCVEDLGYGRYEYCD
jgi:hypothetical protein